MILIKTLVIITILYEIVQNFTLRKKVNELKQDIKDMDWMLRKHEEALIHHDKFKKEYENYLSSLKTNVFVKESDITNVKSKISDIDKRSDVKGPGIKNK